MAITSAIGDFVHSIYELFASFFGAIYNVISGILVMILNFFRGIVDLFADVFGGVFEVLGGVGKFLLGNIVVLGILAAGVFVYVNYQRQQGQGRTVKPQTALKQST